VTDLRPKPLILAELRPVWIAVLTIPPSTNNLFYTGQDGRRHKSKEYCKWLALAGQELVCQRSKQPAVMRDITVPFVIVCEYGRFHDNRRRDLGNREKGLLDLLVLQRVVADDSLVEEMILRWVDDLPAAKVRVTIRKASK
jgi:Holliday junction resolvase RusA-like endonuclease